jgi:hypothetical protein
MASTLNSSRPTGSLGSSIEPPRFEPHVAAGEFVDDVAQRPGEPIELGHDELVARSARGERFAQAGAVAVRPGQAVIDLYALSGHAKRGESVALDGEVLSVSGDTGVADQLGHAHKCVPYGGPWVLAVIATRA